MRLLVVLAVMAALAPATADAHHSDTSRVHNMRHIAQAYWGDGLCSGVTPMTIPISRGPMPADHPEWVAYIMRGGGPPYEGCRIVLKDWGWQTEYLCRVIVHEVGHEAGMDHSPDRFSIMWHGDLAPFGPCANGAAEPDRLTDTNAAPRDTNRRGHDTEVLAPCLTQTTAASRSTLATDPFGLMHWLIPPTANASARFDGISAVAMPSAGSLTVAPRSACTARSLASSLAMGCRPITSTTTRWITGGRTCASSPLPRTIRTVAPRGTVITEAGPQPHATAASVGRRTSASGALASCSIARCTRSVFIAPRRMPRVLRGRPAAGSWRSVGTSPIVLLLPGGGWQSAQPATMDPWVHDFREHGIRARAITYPLRDVVAAIEHVRRIAAAERGPVIAYGISAGGTIAAALAAQGLVDGAVNIAGPTDFERWVGIPAWTIKRQIGMRTRAQMRAASPFYMLKGAQTSQLVQCGAIDPLVTIEQCERYKSAAWRGNHDTTYQRMIAGHNQWSIDRDRARAWVIDHFGR